MKKEIYVFIAFVSVFACTKPVEDNNKEPQPTEMKEIQIETAMP